MVNLSILLSSNINDTHIGQTITVRGRIYHKETCDQDRKFYLYVRDDAGLITAQFNEDLFQKAESLPLETFIAISGIIRVNRTPALTKYILLGSSLELLSLLSDDIEELRPVISTIRFLYIRKPEIKALLLLKRHIKKYAVTFLEEQGFQPVETPIITSFTQINRQAMRITTNKKNEIEERDKYLIQKSQFYLEALAHAFGRVYTLTPAFRADHRESDLLLAEFWLLEVEEIFSSVNEKMDLLESLIKFITKQLIAHNLDDMRNLFIYRALGKLQLNGLKICSLGTTFWQSIDIELKDHLEFLDKIVSADCFPRLKYKDVLSDFHDKGEYFETTHLREKRGDILTTEHNGPVFITHWPFAARHFFDKKNPDDPNFTLSFDLVGHGFYGEIASGSEREFRADIIEERLKEKRLRKDNNQTLQWYYKLQRFGSVPHAGFSIGMERLTAWLTKTENIADVVAFPRRMVGNDINY